MALVPAYQGRLPQPVLPGLVAVGRFDGRTDTLVCAANSGKLMLLSPGQQQSGPVAMETDSGLPVQILNMEQPVLSMCTGRLCTDSESRDALVIGTATDMLVYDVHRNADLFHRPVPDGAFATVVCQCGGSGEGGAGGVQQQQKPRRAAIAGGNCTLLGFDSAGAEAFWSVTGDRVTSMTAGKFLGEEAGELLLVGSEDFELRLFRDDAIVREFTETDSPVALLALPGSARFAYALANGTVGVYERASRLWRIKSKHRPAALAAFDLDSDGQVELLVGWSGGKVDARRVTTGEVVFRDQGPSPVAGLAVVDLRGDGRPPLLTIVGVEGDVRAFDAVPQHLAASLLGATLGEDAPGSMRSLMQAKQSLGLELRNYTAGQQQGAGGGGGGGSGDVGGGMRRTGSGVSFDGTLRVAMGTAGAEASVIPANTQLSSSLSVEADAVVLSVSTSNDTVIRALAVFAEGLFEDAESLVAHPPANQVGPKLALAIRPMRNAAVDLHLKCLVGLRSSDAQFHVFEASRLLPRFATFAWLTPGSAEAASSPTGWVRFRLAERPQRLAMWINNSFLLPPKAAAGAATESSFRFRCVRTGRLLSIDTRQAADEPSATIGVDSLELAAEVVASLAEFLGLDDLASEASFPGLSEQLDSLASQVRQLEAGQARLAADQADSSGLVRSLAVRAEDSRLLGDLANTRQAYADLLRVNRGLVTSHRVRADAHASLVGALKQVGLVIQQGAALRTGRYRAQVIAQCRAAVQDREFGLIYQVICAGSA